MDYEKLKAKTPRTEEEQKALYMKVYDDDYLDEQYEKHYPYSEEFDKRIDAMVHAILKGEK